MNKKLIRIVISIVIIQMMPGCSSIYKSPGIGSFSQEQIAVIDRSNLWDTDIVISDVDGVSRGIGIFKRFELTPGEHSITVTLNLYGYNGGEITRWFNAESGHVYRIYDHVDMVKKKWDISIVDTNNNTKVDYMK